MVGRNAAPVARASHPFVPLAPASKLTLTTDLFTNGAQIAGVQSTSMYFDVALGRMIFIEGGKNLRFYLKAQLDWTVAPSLAAAGNVVVDLASKGLQLVQSTRQQSAFPTSSHPDVIAYTSADGGTTWALATVQAVNWAAHQVTVAAPAGTNLIRVGYLPGLGEFQFRVLRPTGSDQVSAMLFSSTFRAVYEVDQTNLRSAPVFGQAGAAYPLPPQFRLELSVRSPSTIMLNGKGMLQHELAISAYDAPIRVLDLARLNAEAEVRLRGGNL